MTLIRQSAQRSGSRAVDIVWNRNTLTVHVHTPVLDGVVAERDTGALRVQPAAPPGDEDLARLFATIHARLWRLLQRHGLERDAAASGSASSAPGPTASAASASNPWRSGTSWPP